jgi:hypothetical protein
MSVGRSLQLVFGCLCLVTGGVCGATEKTGLVDVNVDWSAYMARQDVVWEVLPGQFDDGAFLGNGVLGATIYCESNNVVRWEMGRADVTEHRRDNSRIPIGGFVLQTVGTIQHGTMRLDLWNAEARGEIKTDKGTIKFRSLIHTKEMILVTDMDATGDEKKASLRWDAEPCIEYVCANCGTYDPVAKKHVKDQPNPPPRSENIDGIPVCVQERYAGGEFAVAWTEQNVSGSERRILLSIADSFPGHTAAGDVVKVLKTVAAVDYDSLLKSHREWWHAFYPQSFVSVPDPLVESFYWIQWYKLACASRPGELPTDLLGPWFRKTNWPRIWWDLNIETLYLPVYSGNRLMLGESLVGFFDAKKQNFFTQAKERWVMDDLNKAGHHFEDCAYVTVTSDNQGLRGDGVRAPDKPNKPYYCSPGNLTWALHDYYLHYRYSMDHDYVTNQAQHAFYPLLRGNINNFLHLMEKDPDGSLHMPKAFCSPEYPHKPDRDITYGLALFRWGCQTLLELNARYQLNDPLIPVWKDALAKLATYPVDENGIRIGEKTPYEVSHRHWSHILMVHPLHNMDLGIPENRKLIDTTINRWMTVGDGGAILGWSQAAASSLRSALGEGDKALEHIHYHLTDKRFVRPNTMYIEGYPVMECSTVINQSLQDMLLQSHGNLMRVFPAMPSVWTNAAFHNLRTEGAFLVSAKRKEGGTEWVRIKSLAGEPCRINPSLQGEVKASAAGGGVVDIRPLGGGAYDLKLEKGGEVVLYSGEKAPEMTIEPVAAPRKLWIHGKGTIRSADNLWGVKKYITPLSSGKPATASGEFSREYATGNAFDDDPKTRWSASPKNSKGGAWLDVDLGREELIGRVTIMETYTRVREFAVERKDGETWKPIVKGARIGRELNLEFPPVKARFVRLNLLKAENIPSIDEFRIYPPLGEN